MTTPAHDNVSDLPARPPRAVFLTSDPLLAEHVRALDPRIATPTIGRLPGTSAPLVPATDGLLLLAGSAAARDAAHTGVATITRTIYVGTDPDDAAVWGRSIDVRANEVLFLPDDDHRLLAEIITQLGPAPTATVTPGPGHPHTPPIEAALDPPGADPARTHEQTPDHEHALHELTDADLHDPLTRWRPAAEAVHLRLPTDPHWPALATQLERIHASGRDVPGLLKTHAWDDPLPEDKPGRTLADRLTIAVPGSGERPLPGHQPGGHAVGPAGAANRPDPHISPERPGPAPEADR